ncbi:glycosyltransferase [Nocardia panacis]|uniref:4,4'-diaponeurosporenoate glycosyltransferase n=1 Tax=Nocardia panacis TaxID=2340916 RepID=A0A3A4KME7_9NOCA|nr:glycosyltransferase [Nocardia panacis]RJO76728.1 glycosyltransferase [Nocardia panacis]
MIEPQQPTLSVVIPALNEADSIEGCLRLLVAQEAIDEVIVVDNGSTDGTPEIVRTFAATNPKVEIIHEARRGIPPARNAGFDKARGDIIARTDADTLVSANWGRVIRDYLDTHPETSAVAGLCTYHDSPIGFLLKFGLWIQHRRGKLGGQIGNLYGPNMALRRTAWEQVREDTQVRIDVAEDLDLALCLSKRGLRIDQVEQMRAQTSARRRRTSPGRWWKFQMIGLRTLADHNFGVTRQARAIVVASWASHTIQWPIYRFWDFDRKRFALRPGVERVSAIG